MELAALEFLLLAESALIINTYGSTYAVEVRFIRPPLYCTILYCTVLHCIVLNSIVLYCIVLYCIAPFLALDSSYDLTA